MAIEHERIVVFSDKPVQWIKNNRGLLYSVAIACFLILNGLYCYKTSDYSNSILIVTTICVLLWCAICIINFYFKKKKGYIHRILLVVLLAIGSLYSLVFQPITAPDEQYHFQSSYIYSNYLMFKNPSSNPLPVREADAEEITKIGILWELKNQRYNDIADNFELFTSNTKETLISPIASYELSSNLPQLKLPSAIGITIARIIGLGFYPLFYLGRLFNFLFFACLCCFAVKITPVAKNAFIAIALLPMTLHLTSSYSYDAGIIGLSFLFTALCFKATYSSEKMTKKDFIAIAIIACLLAPCKGVYSLLVFIVLIIPITTFSSKKRAAFYKTGVIGISFISMLVIKLSTLISLTRVEQVSQVFRGEELGSFHSIAEFFSDPLGTITIFIRTLEHNTGFYFATTIGGALGWFQQEIVAPKYFLLAFALLLVLAFLKTPEDSLIIQKRHRVLFFAIFCFGVFAIMLSMFVAWTFVDETVIVGVQGRYFLPYLPLLALALRSNTIESNRNLQTLILFGLAVMNMVYVMKIFAIVTTIT